MTPVNSLITDNLDIWTTAIKKRSATGRGSNKKIELTGIKKLRELILELAMRGKLVPQDPNDEPASVLLEKIATEKAQLIKEKKIKKAKVLPEIGEDEKLFKLPSGWEWLRLTEAYYSISPSGSKLKGSEIKEQGTHPVVDQGQKFIAGYTELKDLLIKIPQPVIVFGDHTTKIKYIDFNFVAGADGTKILSPLQIYPRYFYRYLLNYDLENRGYARHFKVLNDNLMAIPPLTEQYRIVAKVDEMMRLCDQLEQQTEDSITAHQTLVENLLATLSNSETPAAFNQNWTRIAEYFDTLFTTEHSIDQLKQTILQLAIMGKLVPQNSSDEPASVLLEKIAVEKEQLIKDKKIKKQKPLSGIAEDEKLFELPSGWEWSNLGNITIIRGGKRLPKGQRLTTVPTPYIYIRVSDMKQGTISDNDLHYISEDIRNQISNYIITKNDIYMTIVGATIGKCGLVPSKFDGMNLTENAARLVTYTGIDKTFLFKYLDSSFAQSQFFDKTKQVGVQKMALNRLASTQVPLPPLPEQHRIVKKVDKLITLCDQLKASLNEAQSTQLHLADTIVEQALN